MTSFSCNHCRMSFYELKGKFLFKNNNIRNGISLNTITFSRFFCIIFGQRSNIFFHYTHQKNREVLFIKLTDFWNDYVKIIFSSCRFKDFCAWMYRPPLFWSLYLGYCIFLYFTWNTSIVCYKNGLSVKTE